MLLMPEGIRWITKGMGLIAQLKDCPILVFFYRCIAFVVLTVSTSAKERRWLVSPEG